tara:strand:+ start:452 stop:601 length:150 start_codon:yes stop_codon:yes gene_type:complete
MRYRATIMVDIHEEDLDAAQEKLDKIIGDLSNAFQVSIEELPHGADVSL